MYNTPLVILLLSMVLKRNKIKIYRKILSEIEGKCLLKSQTEDWSEADGSITGKILGEK